MRKISILLIVLLLLVPMASGARTTGDPLDTNDSIESACGLVDKWPSCVPCRTACYYAIINDLWFGGSGWDWD